MKTSRRARGWPVALDRTLPAPATPCPDRSRPEPVMTRPRQGGFCRRS